MMAQYKSSNSIDKRHVFGKALGPERGNQAESSFLDAAQCTPLVAVRLNLPSQHGCAAVSRTGYPRYRIVRELMSELIP